MESEGFELVSVLVRVLAVEAALAVVPAVLVEVFVSAAEVFAVVFPAAVVLAAVAVFVAAVVLPLAAVLVVAVFEDAAVFVVLPAGRPGPLFSVTGLEDAVLVEAGFAGVVLAVEVLVPVFLVDADAFFVVSAPLSLFEF